MCNPFDLRGPEFLVFYLVFGTGVNLLLRHVILRKEKDSPAATRVCSDPYKLAALRGGAFETLRVVTVSLIDRGLLKASGDLTAAEPDALQRVRRPVEQAVVEFFAWPRTAQDIFSNPGAVNAAEEQCRELAAEGLLADERGRAGRRRASLSAIFLLIGVSAAKIGIAVSRGRHNIAFLIILTLVFTVWAIATWYRKRTGAGDEVLRRARLRFRQLKERPENIRPGGENNDAVYLAAVFGLAALPSLYFPYASKLFPQAASGSADGSSGGCGGGGCGGGGCGGGGCGGCGG